MFPVVKSPELTQCKLSFANPGADTDILWCICPGKISTLGTQDFLSGGRLVQNMTQDFFQIFFGFFTVPLPHVISLTYALLTLLTLVYAIQFFAYYSQNGAFLGSAI